MKLPIAIAILLLVVLAVFSSRLHAEDEKFSYAPAVVTLTGTILKESYGDDPPSPRYRGKDAWVLRLQRPISIRETPGDALNVDAANVKEVALNVDHEKHAIPKAAFGKKRFVVTGTLYQPGTTNFLRPVVVQVSSLQPAASK